MLAPVKSVMIRNQYIECKLFKMLRVLAAVAMGTVAGCVASPDVAQVHAVERSLVRLGSNYGVTSVGSYLEEHTEDAWYGRHGRTAVAPIAATYGAANGFAQLKRLRESDQDVVSLVVWHMRMADGNVLGHVVASNGGVLAPAHEANVLAAIEDARALGFAQATLRFAPQGANDPAHWQTWNEDLYQENWNLIVNLREHAKRAAGEMRLQLDLGLELGGLVDGQARAYVKRLFADYTFAFGSRDTYGFSVIWDKHGWVQGDVGRVRGYLATVRELGAVPRAIAIDMYGDEVEALARLRADLQREGVPQLPVVVQEAFANDHGSAAAIQDALFDGQLNITEVQQWPLARGVAARFSMAIADRIHHYRNTPVVRNSGLGCADAGCLWLTAANVQSGCTALFFAPDWRHGATPESEVTEARCEPDLVTVRIPETVRATFTSAYIAVRNPSGAYSEARLVPLQH